MSKIGDLLINDSDIIYSEDFLFRAIFCGTNTENELLFLDPSTLRIKNKLHFEPKHVFKALKHEDGQVTYPERDNHEGYIKAQDRISKMKKYIIAGGREFNDKEYLRDSCTRVINFLHDDIIIFSGGASGADKLGEEIASDFGVILNVFKADWHNYGKSAGPIRNEHMAKNANACIVFWDGKSKGTKNMIDMAIKYKLELHIFFY